MERPAACARRQISRSRLFFWGGGGGGGRWFFFGFFIFSKRWTYDNRGGTRIRSTGHIYYTHASTHPRAQQPSHSRLGVGLRVALKRQPRGLPLGPQAGQGLLRRARHDEEAGAEAAEGGVQVAGVSKVGGGHGCGKG